MSSKHHDVRIYLEKSRTGGNGWSLSALDHPYVKLNSLVDRIAPDTLKNISSDKWITERIDGTHQITWVGDGERPGNPMALVTLLPTLPISVKNTLLAGLLAIFGSIVTFSYQKLSFQETQPKQTQSSANSSMYVETRVETTRVIVPNNLDELFRVMKEENNKKKTSS